ncbi:S8 family serine peptidase [Myxococcus sp. RHSTA-1-4]|uniref:S8 family serine peptidase n=1 Tax=Myxococcus sp. RHSTA-1-4 TaxID=2874601 RepID=UPI001CBDF90F|nr:S8 family serine peptidase [Myxococcus sp. RHSTA-1-4]MBZ4423244.1 S8 family serine peptidase [Myxococcus sp. RHSTA-1-4]
MRVQKPRVKQENDYSYTNKFTKKQLRFSPREDEVVATFQPQASTEAMRGLMSATSMAVSQGMDANRGFAVLKVPRERDLETAERALEARPEVANVLPVLVDDEGLTRYFLPDELTVQFKEGVPRERIEQLLDEKKTPVVAEQRTPGYYTLAVPEERGLFETLRELSALEEVAFAEPSEAGFNDALYVPDDPSFPVLWGLHNTGQVVNGTTGSVDSDTDAVEAWDITRGHPDVIISVIDTGMDLDHPDLVANLLARGSEDWDFADAADPSPDDADGHGTHVSGTAAAVDNGTGVIGLAPGCRLMPLRINLTAGMNQNRADAINYVAAQAVANPSRRYVINCSWKMSGDHAGVHSAIINAVSKNVVVVFAAGNANQDIESPPFYPAFYPEVIAVAATDQQDVRAGFSNYGARVDVSAPGVNIYSSYPDNGYAYLDGTSMASPHVAGLAALVWSRNRGLTNAQVRSIIESTCDNIDAKNPGFIGKLGKGRINAYRAVRATPLPPVKFTLLRRFPFPQKNDGSSSALAYARRIMLAGSLVPRSALLFLTQKPFSERIYSLNPATGVVMGSIDPVNNDTIGSMEWDGSRIRVANVTWGAGFINAIHPGTGAQVGSIPAPVGRGEGLAYDGTYLYYSTINRIHILKPTTGAVVGSFPAPGGTCRALAAGLGHLFCGNPVTGRIYVVELSTHLVRDAFMAPGGGTERVDGLAFNPVTRELFIANQGENIIYVGRVTL